MRRPSCTSQPRPAMPLARGRRPWAPPSLARGKGGPRHRRPPKLDPPDARALQRSAPAMPAACAARAHARLRAVAMIHVRQCACTATRRLAPRRLEPPPLARPRREPPARPRLHRQPLGHARLRCAAPAHARRQRRCAEPGGGEERERERER
jgi:hypothetical protein